MRTLASIFTMSIAAGFLTIACGSSPAAEPKAPDAPEAPAASSTADAGGGEWKACTMDAKMCPDGVTSVGRQGPNCEFAPCPPAKK